jgi:cytochrome c oxidase cbb3-type subunit 1
VLYFSGMLLMAYNTFKTIASGRTVDDPIPSVLAHA